MARRISVSPTGAGATVGTLDVQSNIISTSQTNEDLILDANGTGTVQVDTELVIRNQGDLRLLEATANGTNYIAQHASASMTANYTITWPAAVTSSNGFVLTSDTSGNLSWTNPSSLSISVTDPGASATVHYPVFATNAGAVPTSFTANARSNLSFVPSSGELGATALRAVDHYGSTSASGTITIRGTTNATKATASVLLTDNVASSSTTTGTLVVTGGVGVSGTTYTANLNVTGSTSLTGTAIFAGGAVDNTAASSITYDANGRVTGFVEGTATYSSITYTQFGFIIPEFKITSYTVAVTGQPTRNITVDYNNDGSINTFTVV